MKSLARILIIVLITYMTVHLIATLYALSNPGPNPLALSYLGGQLARWTLLLVLLLWAFRKLGARPTPPPLPPSGA